MKTKLYIGLGALAAIAAVTALSNQGIRDAFAQEIDQPVVDQQQTNQLQTDQDRTEQAQTGRTTTETRQYGRQESAEQSHHARGHYKASELLGLNVRGRSGDDDIGEIKDLMLGRDGRVIYAAVSFGGFLGVGDKLFAVPFDAIEIVQDENDNLYAHMDVSEDQLKNMEGFDQDNWPHDANANFAGRPAHRQADRPGAEVDVDVTR
jgi:hypothetical protein